MPRATIGIRAEDKNEWERRAPLTPDHVAEIIEHHDIDVCVEPSLGRAFPDRDYRAAGARVTPDLSACRVTFGIKEIPAAKLSARGVYAFFSHTTKGQAHNMPMLRRLVELGCTLVDYEKVLDARGRRLIFFGRHAGYAGMIDALWALGQRLAAEGLPTPLARIRLAHDYASLDEATHHVSRIGEELRHGGLPEGLRPLVVGFTGSGNVSLGAQEIFDRLPYVELAPEELGALARDARRPRNVLYKLVLGRAQRFERSAGGGFDASELEAHPELYQSALPRWLPHLTALIHGAYWDPGQPRLLTGEHLERLWAVEGRPRLRLVADIACDIGGGIEPTVRATTPAHPVYLWDVDRRVPVDALAGRGPLVLAVDNLPCQLPLESSQHFGDTLIRFVPDLARCPWELGLAELPIPRAIRDAVVLHQGRLSAGYAGLARHLERAGGASGARAVQGEHDPSSVSPRGDALAAGRTGAELSRQSSAPVERDTESR